MVRGRILLSSALLLCLIGGFACGADDSAQDRSAPGRVGDISVAEGDVSIRLPATGRPGALTGAWSDAGINDPVAAGMAVRTAASGRAVLRVGADLIAFSGGAEADIVKLDRAGTTIALRRGRLGVRLAESDKGRTVEIALPNGTVFLSAPGEYDILAGEAKSPARLAVLAGEARVSGNGLDNVVASGTAALLTGADSVSMLPGGIDPDAFVAWWRAQQRDAADAPVLHYVSAAVTGHEMLDGNGAWENVPGFGEVWFPKDLPREWAPFRYGHWRWIVPWGWTWVDDRPWGFATSHYGRWANIGGSDSEAGRWGWVPGKRPGSDPGTNNDEPGFMPAAVAFLGTAGVGLSYPDAFSPAVAWFPLAPGEVYWPSYTSDLDAIRRLNAGAVADPAAAIGPARNDHPPAEIVNGAYRNRRFASVVPRPIFVGGKPVADAMIALPARRLENAPLLAGSPGIEPPAAASPVAAAAVAAGSGVVATLAKARDTLTRILKSHEAKKSPLASAVSPPVLKMLIAEKRDAKPRGWFGRKHGAAHAIPAAMPARPAGPTKTPLHRVEKSRKPLKSHAAELRRADSGG